jgi:hypothetical protein
MEVAVTIASQPGEELLLQGEEELSGENAEVRVPLLSLAPSFGGGHVS